MPKEKVKGEFTKIKTVPTENLSFQSTVPTAPPNAWGREREESSMGQAE